MSGVVGMGREQLGGALQGGNSAAARENERNAANEQLDQAAKAQRQNAQMTGMGTGAMVGAYAASGSIGGPWGAAIGAVVGLIAGTLFS